MTFTDHRLQVRVSIRSDELARAAAADIARALRRLLRRKPTVNLVVSGAESQQELHRALAAIAGIDWKRINALAVDEFYAPGMNPDYAVAAQPKRDLYAAVRPRSTNLIDFRALHPLAEARRYERVVRRLRPDIAILGIGISGHVALNEPGLTDFHDERSVKFVQLTEKSKEQLRADSNFRQLGQIPDYGITVTLSELARCPNIFVIVPYAGKAEIVARFLASPVTPDLPATLLKTRRNARLYLDADSFARSADPRSPLPDDGRPETSPSP